jgi:hypothetical protein
MVSSRAGTRRAGRRIEVAEQLVAWKRRGRKQAAKKAAKNRIKGAAPRLRRQKGEVASDDPEDNYVKIFASIFREDLANLTRCRGQGGAIKGHRDSVSQLRRISRGAPTCRPDSTARQVDVRDKRFARRDELTRESVIIAGDWPNDR